MNTKEYIYNKYNIRDIGEQFIEIPNMNRDNLAGLFSELGFSIGAEIGVKYGDYSNVLCSHNHNLHLYSVDSWEVYKDSIYGSQEDLDSWYQTTKDRLSIYPECVVVKGYSLDVAKTFADNSLDFVYIDANHRYKFIYEDLVGWIPKVKVGGIVSGHDFLFSKNCNVGKAVTDYAKLYNIHPVFLVPGDRSRSWFWIKERQGEDTIWQNLWKG